MTPAPDIAAIVVLSLYAALLIAWLIAEWRSKRRAPRIFLGLMLVAGAFLLQIGTHLRARNHNAWNHATVRLIGDALDRNDIDTVREAIRLYESEATWHPAFPDLDYLTEAEDALSTSVQPNENRAQNAVE